jgi:hypothetical protein
VGLKCRTIASYPDYALLKRRGEIASDHPSTGFTRFVIAVPGR